jgi:beta-glucosidase
MVAIKKGETKTVTFTLTDKELGFYNNNGEYLVEPGIFKIFVGTSSDNTQEAEFELK